LGFQFPSEFMGIRGLTTYLQENQRTLCNTLSLPSVSPVPLVVDGWSFIYEIHRNSGLPWVYGGEYESYHRLVSVVVNAWIKVGFRLYFVFDGAYPPLKFPTLSSRLSQSHIQPSLLFFRTSSISRGTHRFLSETRIIPPLSYTTCVEALQKIRRTTDALEIHFADEEGDPYAVELAGRVGGYVAGNDSDFVVLNANGYRGYVPLNELMWYSSATTLPVKEQSDHEFQTVRKPKATKKPTDDAIVGRGIIPPDVDDQLAVTFKVYNPDTLAAHLKIPSTLLPLLGALIGNDYSVSDKSQNIQSLFFDRGLSSTQRISRVAHIILTILSPIPQKRQKHKHQLGSVMDLIDRSVNALLPRSTTLNSNEIEKIVDKIVDATLQYAIPRSERSNHGSSNAWSTGACPLHEPEFCPLLPLISRNFEMINKEGNEELSNVIKIRNFYLDAYRNGQLSPKIMDILNSATFWPRLFLENPDIETVGRSIGRPLREWGYAVIHDAVGLPYTEVEDTELGGEEHDNSDDEIVDVVESDDESGEDLLAPLKGQLQLLHGSDEGGTEPPIRVPLIQQHSRMPTVTEYIRRGTRVAEEVVVFKPLRALLSSISVPELHRRTDISTPLLLWPREDRLTVFLQVLGSDILPVRALSSEQLTVALSLRWALRITHERAQVFPSKDQDNERWSRREAHCFLASFSWTNSPADETNHESEFPPISNRSIQLMAQTLSALESIEHLSQILLLSEIVPSPACLLSGRTFHRHLTNTLTVKEPDTLPLLWEACSHGLDGAFREERAKKAKKVKK
ncbi:hypothetical protein BDZ94DRAFT_1124986, partial [Collybia nuda]